MQDHHLAKRFLSVLFISFGMCIVNMAQSPRFQRITADDGLSQNSVVNIAQDSFGFLWFATQDGLNKYDGSNFTKYEAFFRDKTEIDKKSELGKVFIDDTNRLWATMNNGSLQYLDFKTNEFILIEGLSHVSYITQTATNEFWIASF